jgi:hypothetical protein
MHDDFSPEVFIFLDAVQNSLLLFNAFSVHGEIDGVNPVPRVRGFQILIKCWPLQLQLGHRLQSFDRLLMISHAINDGRCPNRHFEPAID